MPSANTVASPWLISLSNPQPARRRLFCAPYAGGSAQIFQPWAEYLPDVELFGIQAPGKGGRLLEQPCASVAELVDALLAAMTPMLFAKPFSLFGHSNGALIAFELSCVLQERNLPLPQHLFLSASSAPWARMPRRSYAAMSDAEFKDVLRDLQGTPPAVLENDDLFELIKPGLLADFSLAERYVFSRGSKLRVPTSIYYGDQDNIQPWQVRAWQEQIERPVKFERIPGGHFFIHSHLGMLTRLIDAELSGSAALDRAALACARA
jgi:medium-chain acyl-[acyl-carrier-protein] hydrolase